MVGWSASESALKKGRALEVFSLILVGVYFIVTMVASLNPEIGSIHSAFVGIGAISFVLCHGSPIIVDAITGGRARLGFWSVLGFWGTLVMGVLLMR